MSEPSQSGDSIAAIVCDSRDRNCDYPEAKLASQANEVTVSLEAAFESAAVGMGLVDLNGHWLKVNQAFCDLVGFEKAELLRTDFLAITHADDVSRTLEFFRRLARGETDSYHLEKRYLHKSGRMVWASLSVSLVRSPDGSPAFVSGQIQNITKRKEAEEALQRSEAMFRAIGENAGDPILVVGYPDLKILYASSTYEVIFGHSPSMLEGTDSLTNVHPDDRVRISHLVREMVETGRNGNILEVRMRDNQGAWHHVESHTCAVRGSAGEIEKFVVICRVVDDRIMAQQELRDREEQLQLLLDSTAEAIYGLDLEGKCTFCNNSCLRLLGYKNASEVLGKKLHELIHCSHAENPRPVYHLAILEALVGGNGTHVENEMVWRSDGTSFPAECWSYPVRRNGDLVGCVVTFVDISERILAQEALRGANEQSTLFINSVPSILIGMDTRGRITRWNLAAATAFDLPEDKVIDRPLAECGINWRRPQMEAEIAAWCTERDRRRYDDVPFERNGETRLLGLTINWMAGEELLIVGSDITEKRALEEQLRQAQKLEAIGQLAAGIAHEINTPTQYVGDNNNFLKESWNSIAPLLQTARRLRLEAEGGAISPTTLENFDHCSEAADLDYLEQEIPRALDQSLDGIQRVTKIVRAMKEFSHPGNEEKREIDVNKAIETTITIARNEWKYVAEVETHLSLDLPLVPCHAGEFNQVILNLVINAAHAIANAVGEGNPRKGKITVTTEQDGDYVRISLRDSGTGIPEHIRSRVFDPFFTTKPVGQGTGQGLALAHNTIVRRHGGTIWFDTEVGKGTTFFIRLPLAAATAE